MSRPSKGKFIPTSPQKYTGDYPIIYRSSWELEFMKYCDVHPDVMEWASEPVKIPYKNPMPSKTRVAGSQSIYIPDFLVTFLKATGEKAVKLIEIKPVAEADEKFARNGRDVAIRLKNEAKWGAAHQWAQRRGVDFITLTEQELFANHANRKGRAHPVKAIGPAQPKKSNPKAPNRKKAPGTTGGLAKASRKSKLRVSNRSSNSPKARKIPKARKR